MLLRKNYKIVILIVIVIFHFLSLWVCTRSYCLSSKLASFWHPFFWPLKHVRFTNSIYKGKSCVTICRDLPWILLRTASYLRKAGTVMSLDSVPKELRHLRACLSCSLIKTSEQFESDGCDNCEKFLRLKGDREQVFTCTSANFDGVISMMSPDDSWVAKWQRIEKFKPGCYAVSVRGKLPGNIIRQMKGRGIPYKSRDTSSNS